MSVAYASQTLTSTGTIPTANDTVTVGGKVYTYKASVTTVDGEVDLGANAAEALANLKAAINLGAGAGSLYGSGTVVNPDVVADTLTATTLVVRAKVPGTVGNFIAATEASTQLSWGAAVLAGGTGSIKDDIEALILAHQMPAALEQQLRDLTDPLSAE
jgi:hypothetical protein